MSDDLFQSVSQGGIRAQDAENRRVGAIADELRRLCRIHEAQRGESCQDVTRFEVEQRVAEVFAKKHGLWIPMENVFDLGIPGPSGNENDTYVAEDSIYKVNNLLNSGNILNLLDKVRMHNTIFPETFYRLHAFTGFDGRTVMPVLQQRRISNSNPTPQIAIDTFMAAIGFSRDDTVGRYFNDEYIVWDLIPRNVLSDRDGDVFVVDAEIRRNEG